MPVFNPTFHNAELDNGDADHDPYVDEYPACNAKVVVVDVELNADIVPDVGDSIAVGLNATVADNDFDDGSFDDGTTVGVEHPATVGVVSAQSGNCTSRNRADQSAEYPPKNDE